MTRPLIVTPAAAERNANACPLPAKIAPLAPKKLWLLFGTIDTPL
jgi:hypothetical protein